MTELPLEALIGRERELAEINGLLGSARFVSVTGLGGTGKTRVAREVCRRWIATGRPATFVDLAPITEASLVAAHVARALEIEEVGGVDPADQVDRHLHAWDGLLILDNLEHLPNATPLVQGFARASVSGALLTTTRIALRVSGEHEYQLRPLAPPRDASTESLAASPAVALFLREAERTGAMDAWDTTQLMAIGEICRSLGGIPLALEIAAARTRVLAPSEIARRLRDHLPVLPRGGAQSIEPIVVWTVESLSDTDRSRFHALGVLAGPFDLSVAAAIWEVDDPVDTIANLADRALIQRAATAPDGFDLLVPIRDFAWDALEAEGRVATVMRRLADFVDGEVADLAPGLIGPRQVEILALLRERIVVYRTVLDWAVDADEALAARVVGELRRFWGLIAANREARDRARRLLAVLPETEMAARARLLDVVASAELSLHGPIAAEAVAQEALAEARRAGDRSIEQDTLFTLGKIQLRDPIRALETLETGLAIARDIGDERAIMVALANRSINLYCVGKVDDARRGLHEAARRAAELGDQLSEAMALGNLAVIFEELPTSERLELFAEAEAILGPLGPSEYGAWLASAHAQLLLDAGFIEQADAAVRRAVVLARQAGGWEERFAILWRGAWLLHLRGDDTTAARLVGALERAREISGTPAVLQGGWEAQISTIRRSVGRSRYDTLVRAGSALSIDRGLAELEQALERDPVHAARPRGPFGRLSPREIQVLGLVTQGATDPEIADELGISAKTASVHVSNLKTKVGVESRIDLAIAGRSLLPPPTGDRAP